jgi:hypothetical protein
MSRKAILQKLREKFLDKQELRVPYHQICLQNTLQQVVQVEIKEH